MNLVFFNAKNGSPICKKNEIALHSTYNPESEASRFAENANANFIPKLVIVIEPCLSYCFFPLKKKFPNAQFFCIRFDKIFSNEHWDGFFFVNEKNENELSEKLFEKFGEETIFSTIFLAWKESESAWQNEMNYAWNEIKKVILKSRDILFTRNHFANRWIVNAFLYCTQAKKFVSIQKGNCPIVITASGASLETALPYLKKNRKKFFLIALSSSLSVLAHANIIPDLCISTDGGFYAKNHLSPMLRLEKKIPLAVNAESAVQNILLSNENFVTLSYGDGIAEKILRALYIPCMHAMRNGSVSGTALFFAQSITDGNIFFAGLDMENKNGVEHARPNENENRDAVFYCKKNSCEQKKVSRIFSTSLSVYRSWFQTQNNLKKVFRISEKNNYRFSLGSIRDVDFNFFENAIENAEKKFPMFTKETSLDFNKRKNLAKNFLQKMQTTDEWLKDIFPLDYLLYEREIDDEKKLEERKKLFKKNNALTKKLRRLLK